MGANTTNAPGTNMETSAWTPISVSTLTAPPGTAFVRYQLEFDNSSTNGGAVCFDDCGLNKLNWTDPDITNPQPASVTIYAGESASFTVYPLRRSSKPPLYISMAEERNQPATGWWC